MQAYILQAFDSSRNVPVPSPREAAPGACRARRRAGALAAMFLREFRSCLNIAGVTQEAPAFLGREGLHDAPDSSQ